MEDKEDYNVYVGGKPFNLSTFVERAKTSELRNRRRNAVYNTQRKQRDCEEQRKIYVEGC